MRVKAATVASMVGMMVLHSSSGAETEAPEALPLELLEFLADWQDDAGELVDPLMLEVEPRRAEPLEKDHE